MHRKTQDFIFSCKKNNIKIDIIIAAPRKKINYSKLSFKTSINVKPIFHPRDLADFFSIDYVVKDHNSIYVESLLNELRPKVGMIAGARILDSRIINSFSKGIINFHPGDIPIIRGLYSPLRAIKNNHPQFVTSHIIDSKIDLGKIILKKKVEYNKGDSIYDIYENIYSKQIEMIPNTIDYFNKNKFIEYTQEVTSYENEKPYKSYSNFLKDFKKYNP